MAQSKSRRWTIRLIQAVILLVVAFFIYRMVASSWHEIGDSSRLEDINWAWLAAAMLIYVVGLIPAAWFWSVVLDRTGQRERPLHLAAAYFVGGLGKYVPGKAMVVVIRVAMLRNRTCSLRAAAASVFYETLTMMAVGGFLGAGIVAVLYRDRWFYVLIALGMAFASLAPTLPPVFAWLTTRLGAGSGADSADAGEPNNDAAISPPAKRIDAATMLIGWAAHLVGWTVLGCSLWAVCAALGFQAAESYAAWPIQLAVCVAATCLAMVAGFLSLIPAGALVRESMILAVLAPAYGKTEALVAAIVLRLVWLAGELLISSLLYATVKGAPVETTTGSKPSPRG